MIRSLIVFFLFLFGAFFTGLYVAYDEIDPCRALAVENARSSPLPTTVAEMWSSITTEKTDRLSCSRSLIKSWFERLGE